MNESRFCFLADWYDAQSCLMRRYQLMFYPADNSIELFEVKTKRHFLRRCKSESITLNDLFIGAKVTILSRTMGIVEFGDAYTQRALESVQEKTIGILLNGHLSKLGQILDNVYKSDLKIVRMKRLQIASQEAYDILQNQRNKPNFTTIANAISDAPIIVVELLGIDAAKKWTGIVGLGDLVFDLESDAKARIFDGAFNASVNKRVGSNTATYNDCTCCVIKPHLINAGMLGAVIYEIQKAGFEISAVQTFNFTKPNAEEFLEIYKGVVQEYPNMVEELTSGVCVALEIRAQNAQQVFREFCGPHDPEISRTLRPKTLRALFGVDKTKNAVHCTDLADDAALEVEYFFRILDTN